jgi:hypothetical protein
MTGENAEELALRDVARRAIYAAFRTGTSALDWHIPSATSGNGSWQIQLLPPAWLRYDERADSGCSRSALLMGGFKIDLAAAHRCGIVRCR